MNIKVVMDNVDAIVNAIILFTQKKAKHCFTLLQVKIRYDLRVG